MTIKQKTGSSYLDNTIKLSDTEERKLIANIARGNKASFTVLMRLYQTKIRSYCQMYTAKTNEQVDDLAQDIFLQIYNSCLNFKGNSKVSTWIFSIAKYTIYNKIRKKKLLYFWKLLPSKEVEITNYQFVCNKDGAFYYESEENKQLIKSCLATLKPQHHEALVLFEFADLNYEQISDILDISIGTVKSRIFRARKELAKNISKRYE